MMIALALGLPSGLALLIGLPLGICLPYKLVGVMARRRGAKFLGQFPDAIDLIVRGINSGLPISEAVAAVGREIGDPLGQEFRAVAAETGRASWRDSRCQYVYVLSVAVTLKKKLRIF